MTEPPTARPRREGLSLEHKLPLLITALLVVTMAAGVVFAHAEVKQTAVVGATERLELVARQLSGLVPAGLTQRIGWMRETAADPAVLAYVAATGDGARPAATAALQRLRARAPSPVAAPELPIMLWTPERTPLLQLGAFPDSAVGGAIRRALPGPLPDATGVGRLFDIGGRGYFWMAVPVRRGGATVGYVAELRRVGGANTAQQIETLIGRDVAVFFANTAGDAWVALDGATAREPSGWPFTGAARYAHGPRGEHFGHAAPVPGTPWSVVVEQPLGTVLARPDTFLRRAAAAALLLSLAGAAGAWLLSRSITRPVRDLRLASEAIARGDYARRIDLRRSDELGVLAERFNWMAAQVQGTHAELTEQYQAAQSMAEELELAAAEAETARGEAEAASRIKSEFLATMSHEIRTPINAIIGYTELLQLGVSGPVTDTQQAQLERIRVSGKHLIGLVDQVLDFARLEGSTLRVERHAASAAEAVETALTVLRPQAEAKGVELSAACGGDGAVRYLGDPQRVEQIVVNLLSNAVKFTEPGGRASVRCDACEGAPPGGAPGRWTCVTVEDTGVGIPPEERERIFEPFVQGESGYTRRHGGAGLGLAISLRLARSMGGDLSVHSEPGNGSRFTLWLPAPPEAAEAAPGPETAHTAAPEAGAAP